MKDIKKQIGKRIRIIRKQLNKNIKEFAELLDFDNSLIARYEKGKIAPKAEFLMKLFLNLNVNPAYLFKGELPIFLEKKEDTSQTFYHSLTMILKDTEIKKEKEKEKEKEELEEWINIYFENPNLAKMVIKLAKIDKEIKKEVEKLVKAGIPYEKALLHLALEKL